MDVELLGKSEKKRLSHDKKIIPLYSVKIYRFFS